MVQHDPSSEHPTASAEPPKAAQAPDAAHAASPTHAEDAGPKQRWPWYLAGIVVAASIGVVLWLIYAPKPDVWTNDAYVQVHYATIAPRVSGQIDKVAVDNNQIVKTGEILVTLDGRDYRTAVNSAEAALARDRASVAIATAALQRQQSAIDQSKSQLDTATAQLAMAQADADRYEELASTGAGTVKTRQQADTALLQGKATLDGARASLDSARVTLKVLKAQEDAAKATVDADDAALNQARLNLSYTEMRAPLDGMVAQRSVQVGNYVGPGAGLMAVVPLQDVYVEANYQESQLRHVKAGQSVRIHVDAYGIDLQGTVVGVPAATGITFATIPAENATGNFTKVVQRLPVEIRIEPGQPAAKLLRVGLSVETTIHTALASVVGAADAAGQR